jgi:hypothetical protein
MRPFASSGVHRSTTTLVHFSVPIRSERASVLMLVRVAVSCDLCPLFKSLFEVGLLIKLLQIHQARFGNEVSVAPGVCMTVNVRQKFLSGIAFVPSWPSYTPVAGGSFHACPLIDPSGVRMTWKRAGSEEPARPIRSTKRACLLPAALASGLGRLFAVVGEVAGAATFTSAAVLLAPARAACLLLLNPRR